MGVFDRDYMCEGGGNRILINEKFKSEVTILDDWRRGVYY
jgi:hypothetical protein